MFSIVHSRGIQLVSEILLLASDTLHTQCRHIEYLHEGFFIQKIHFLDKIFNLAIFSLCASS